MQKKTFKHYVYTYLIGVFVVLLIMFISYINGRGFIVSSIDFTGDLGETVRFLGHDIQIGHLMSDGFALIVIPLLFTIMYFLIDLVLGKVDKKSKKSDKGKDPFDKYLDSLIEKMTESNKFIIEDYRKFRESDRFQTVLKHGFEIQTNGETEQNNFKKLYKKYDSNSKEYLAITLMEELYKEKEENK